VEGAEAEVTLAIGLLDTEIDQADTMIDATTISVLIEITKIAIIKVEVTEIDMTEGINIETTGEEGEDQLAGVKQDRRFKA